MRRAVGALRSYRFVIAFAAFLLAALLTGCGQPARSSDLAARQPTPTLAPAHPLAWQPFVFPGAVRSAGPGAVLALAPGDANTIYACNNPGSATSMVYQIWVSHDAGVHWRHVSDLPIGQPGGCSLIVDAAQPSTAVATIYWYAPGASPFDRNSRSFATMDGGATWQTLSDQQDFAQLATFQGRSYALLLPGTNQQAASWRLAVSTDGLRSWQTIDDDLNRAGQTVGAFWLDSATGAILADTFAGSAHALWKTEDGGQHWTALSDPGISPNQIAVQWPAFGEAWHICAGQQLLDRPDLSHNLLVCSTDGGSTWRRRPALDITVSCATCLKGNPFTSISEMRLVTIAADGSLLAIAGSGYDESGEVYSLYRLSTGASQWQPLGQVPGAGSGPNIYALGSGTLYSFYSLGDIAGDPMACAGPADQVYRATYP